MYEQAMQREKIPQLKLLLTKQLKDKEIFCRIIIGVDQNPMAKIAT